ncbi:MAG: class I SAM-dependent methyltransferase [Algoriphagus sp.]|nr:class I SAM-dependent methyltransferase [Algoriphagus sp.]
MSKTVESVLPYLNYWLQKEDLYSQQSTFVFSIYAQLTKYLRSSIDFNSDIEDFRKRLLVNQERLAIQDFGAGSKRVNDQLRPVSKVTRYSTSSSKFATLYQYFCKLTPAEYVIELGTCVGISTRYLSKVTVGNLWTIEGSEALWRVAQANPRPEKTKFVLGEISYALPPIIKRLPRLDFALIDANHTYEGTMTSFHSCLEKINPKSILIIGDIHWSKEMECAWTEIKEHPAVKLTFDFFECGVLFFEYSGSKTHLILDI